MFLIGKKQELLNALGITYGTINIEGCQAFLTIDVETAETVLNHAVEKNLVEPPQVATIMEQIRTAGLALNLKAVFEKAVQTKVPKDFVPSFKFELHKDCSLPLPHGSIVNPEEEGGSEPMMTLVGGLNFLIDWVSNSRNQLHILDGVSLLNEMIVAKLPINEADSEAKYLALSQEVRDQLENALPIRGFETFSIPGFGDVMVMELRLPIRRSQQPQAK